MYYVYILFSLKDKQLYIGKTSDLFQRLKKHDNGQVISTKCRRPLILVHCEVYKTAKEAYSREKELKYPSAGEFKKKLKERLNI